ncbi:MAG: Gfo/Idh/MocA family oxidoreductase [Candidatus Dormiibacterota bacterium]
MSGRIRIGVVGAGLMGLRHARVLASMPGVELAGVVDTDEAARQRAVRSLGVAATSSLAQLAASNPQAVVVALPDDAHREVTLEALDRGLAVLVEKPLATSVEDAEAIVKAARGRLLMVGHLLRFDPRYLGARRRVQAGELGGLLHTYARRNSASGATLRYGATTRLPWHVSIHDLDALRWVTGREVVTMRAHGVSRVFARLEQLDSLQALLRLDDGSTAVIESCWALPAHLGSAIDSRLEVAGTQGMLEVTGFEQGLFVADRSSSTYPDTTRYAEYEDGAGGGILAAELAHFVRCIDRGVPPSVAPEDGLAAVRLAAALEQSLREDREVRLS